MSAPKTTPIGPQGNRGSTISWGGLRAEEHGEAVEEHASGTVQVEGTFGGAEVVLMGRIADEWEPIPTQWGSAVWTSAGIKNVSAEVVAVKPMVDGGDDTTSITVTMFNAKRK